MQPLKSFMGAGLIALAVPATAANVSVAFVHPEKYADAGYSHSFASERDRAEVQRDIEQHLQRLAERGLPASDALKIEVLDIDLAGHFEPFRFRNGPDADPWRSTGRQRRRESLGYELPDVREPLLEWRPSAVRKGHA